MSFKWILSFWFNSWLIGFFWQFFLLEGLVFSLIYVHIHSSTFYIFSFIYSLRMSYLFVILVHAPQLFPDSSFTWVHVLSLLRKDKKRKKPLKYGVLFLGYCLCTSMLHDKLLKANLCALQKHCPCSLPHQNLPRVHHCAWYPAGIRNWPSSMCLLYA